VPGIEPASAIEAILSTHRCDVRVHHLDPHELAVEVTVLADAGCLGDLGEREGLRDREREASRLDQRQRARSGSSNRVGQRSNPASPAISAGGVYISASVAILA
jgi:hypothetical protein